MEPNHGARPLAGLALGVLALHLLTSCLYGYHRDELYLLACGRRLAWGSIDHAPLTPALSRLQELVLGASPARQRLVAALCAALVVWLTGQAARRLGGGRTAQLLAAGSVAIAPVFLFMGGVQSTNAVDQLCWASAQYLLLSILAADACPRAPLKWLLLGGVLGLGLLNKYSVLLCGLGLVLGLLGSRARAQLLAPWPWLAALLALALALPNLLWQRAHGWPALEFLHASHQAMLRDVSLSALLYDQPRLLHPFSFAVALVGLPEALRPHAPAYARPFGVLLVAVLAAVLAGHGKAYYVAPAYPMMLALGGVVCARWLDRRRPAARRAVALAWLGGGALALCGTLPVLPASTQARLQLHRFNRELIQFADWKDVVSQIATAYYGARDSAHTGILTDSYGTAAALEQFGPPLGLPAPSSGANSYFAWGPGPAEPDQLIVMGYAEPLLVGLCQELDVMGRIRSQLDLDNRFDFPRTIFRCRGLREPLRQAWPRLRRFD